MNFNRLNTLLKIRHNEFFTFKDVMFNFCICFIVALLCIGSLFLENLFITSCLSMFLFVLSLHFKEIIILKHHSLKYKNNLIIFFIDSLKSLAFFFIINTILVYFFNDNLKYGDSEFVNVLLGNANILFLYFCGALICLKTFIFCKKIKKNNNKNRLKKLNNKILLIKSKMLKSIQSIDDIDLYRESIKENEENIDFAKEMFNDIEKEFYKQNGVKNRKEYLIKNKEDAQLYSSIENS